MLLGQSILKTDDVEVQESSPCHSFYQNCLSQGTLGTLSPRARGQTAEGRRPLPWILAGPYPIWICPEYMVRSSMMVKPVKRPRFWMTKGTNMLPFHSSSWPTSFISGNWERRENKSAAAPSLTCEPRRTQCRVDVISNTCSHIYSIHIYTVIVTQLTRNI